MPAALPYRNPEQPEQILLAPLLQTGMASLPRPLTSLSIASKNWKLLSDCCADQRFAS